MKPFINPPRVGQRPITTNATPLHRSTVEKVLQYVEEHYPNNKSEKSKDAKWLPNEVALLKARWPIQGELIPELLKPTRQGCLHLFTGKFTREEIIKKARELGLATKN